MELAIAFGESFWPDFFEYDGCVMRGAGPDGQFVKIHARNLALLKGDRQAVETLRNHLHVHDQFSRTAGDPQPTRDQCRYLARLLREMREAKLARELPVRTFRVVVNDDLMAADDGDFQLTFCHVREDRE